MVKDPLTGLNRITPQRCVHVNAFLLLHTHRHEGLSVLAGDYSDGCGARRAGSAPRIPLHYLLSFRRNNPRVRRAVIHRGQASRSSEKHGQTSRD